MTDKVKTLSPSLIYELIPDCPAATSAGYTADQRSQAQLWYAPIIADINLPGEGKIECFLYAAWHGNILDTDVLSSILVVRRVSDASLVYAVDCGKFGLDSAPNFRGINKIICRVRLFINDDSLYLCNSQISNVGPQLFCLDPATGKLKWRIAYYPPASTGLDFINQPGDYSSLAGQSCALSDLSPNGGYYTNSQGKKVKYVIVGSSSFQNYYNANHTNPGQYLNGYPRYTDQGQCVCIEDAGDHAKVLWKTSTCGRAVKVGDVLKKGGPPELDPFLPDQDKVVFFSVTQPGNNFVQPYYLSSPDLSPLPVCPISANVFFDKNTNIDKSMLQQVWQDDPFIYQDSDRSTGYNVDQLIKQWKDEQAKLKDNNVTIKHVIWGYVPSNIIEMAKTQANNLGIGYFKWLSTGQSVDF